MSAVGKIIRGRSRAVRCDGCGRISSDRESGYYVDGDSGQGGNITGHGLECRHDFCDQCIERKYLESFQTEVPRCPICNMGRCDKCGQQRRILTNVGTDSFPSWQCGTCIHREERRIGDGAIEQSIDLLDHQ